MSMAQVTNSDPPYGYFSSSGGAPMDFKGWVKQFTEFRASKFCIPNPRKFGRGEFGRYHRAVISKSLHLLSGSGDKIWSDWNWLSNFWGYGQDGFWASDIKNAFNIPKSRKRSRIEGPL